MNFNSINRRIKNFLFLIVILCSFSAAYSQDIEIEMEIAKAMEDVENGNYDKSISVLRKYSDMNGFSDLKKFSINVYLNWSYLKTNHDSLDIKKVNSLTNNYLLKNGISKVDSALSLNEIKLIYTAASINKAAGQIETMISFLLPIKDHFEELKLTPNYSLFQSLAEGYRELKEYDLAINFGLEALQLNFKSNGEKNHASLIILDLLNYAYKKTNQFEKALESKEKFIDIGIYVLGEEDPFYLEALHSLGEDYSKIGNNNKALEVIKSVVLLREKVLGQRNKDYLNSLSNLAGVYSKLNEPKKSLEILIKLIELSELTIGIESEVYFKWLKYLADTYQYLGEYSNSINTFIKLSNKKKEVFGDRHIEYIISLMNLGVAYSHNGDHLLALETKLFSHNLLKETYGRNNSNYIISLMNLGVAYSKIGQHYRSIELKEEAVKLGEVFFGEKSTEYLTFLSNLAISYIEVGLYEKALECSLKVKNFGKEAFGERNSTYLTTLQTLSNVYIKINNFSKALEISEEVTRIRKELFGIYHPDYLLSLSHNQQIYYSLGEYEKSYQIALLNEEISKKKLGVYHPHYLNRLNNLSIIELELNKINEARLHYFQMISITREFAIKYFSNLTKDQREAFWKEKKGYFYAFPMFLENLNNKDFKYLIDSYNTVLFLKGSLLNTSNDFNKVILESGSQEVLNKFEEFKILNAQIQKLNENYDEFKKMELDSLQIIAESVETDLVKMSKEYGDYTENLKITWEDVQNNLRDEDVAIEFLEYPTMNDSIKFAALILRKGWENPKFIPLFRKDQVVGIINRDPNQIYSNGIIGKETRKLVWDPLEEFIAPGDKVHFSAAGILHQLAIENLSFDESTTLGDRYQMNRLSSTKELALKKPESKNQNVALYGGIKYDLSIDQMIAESEKYERKDSFLAVRGFDQDSLDRKGWQFLPGTLAEANEVSQILNEGQYQVTKFIGEAGSEESLKDLSGKRTGIIHIATHGFFLPLEQSQRNPFIQMRFDDRNANVGYVDPMLRSGLLLAGGNRAWQGDSIPETIEDGVLTAKEISQLDLRETDLVVLSACETGLGDVSSEGVFGLQRAFKQAGAQTLIMSLWNVKDEATQYLMTNFYSYLTQGASKREAFIQARNKCREKYQDPASWAAFIMLD